MARLKAVVGGLVCAERELALHRRRGPRSARAVEPLEGRPSASFDRLDPVTSGSPSAPLDASFALVVRASRAEAPRWHQSEARLVRDQHPAGARLACLDRMQAPALSARAPRLEYVRIEYAGDVYAMDNELNGLTLGGCGSDTVIDYVQVHAGADDAFEMFGGTVNLRHVIATAMDDDGIDWDFGWRGNVQFALVIHTASASSGDPNAIEADNNKDSNDATPRSNPTIYNLTAVGSPDIGNNSFGAVLRRGTYGSIRNAIFTSWKTAAIDARDASTIAAIGTSLTIENSIFHQNGAEGTAHFSATATPFGTEATNDTATDPMVGTSAPYAPSAAITTGAATPTGEWFDATATFIGAIGADDWTAGWTSFPGL